jgi:hypothetical protein
MLDKLKAFADEQARSNAPPAKPGRSKWDIDEWIRERDIPVTGREKLDGGVRYIYVECPNDPNHKDAAIIIRPDGTIGFKCFHNSCSDWDWRKYREHYEPGCYSGRDTAEDFGTVDLDSALDELASLAEKDKLSFFRAEVLPSLVELPPIEQAVYTKKAAKLLDVSMAAILKEIREECGEDFEEKSQADFLTEIALANRLFHDDLKEPYASVAFEGHDKILKIGGRDFARYLAGEYYKQTTKAPANEAIKQAANVAEANAIFEGPEYKLELRVASHDGAFWYDLADDKNRAIRITPQGWEVVARPPIIFRRRNNQAPQVDPVPGTGDIWQMERFINASKEDIELIVIYLVTCLVPGIPHAMPIFHGEKGAAKSTTMQFLRRLVDPANRELFVLPRDQNELALQLYGNYMPAYDNLSVMSQMQSDTLCGAATGGGVSKRTLFSNDDDTILRFFCCPMMNGINVVANAPDLLDRCLMFELQRLERKERKERKEVFADFEKARACVFTGMLDALSGAMRLYPNIHLNELPRMADFAKWGYAIAEVIGVGGGNFLDLYQANLGKINDAAVEADPVATLIVEMMKVSPSFEGTMRGLLEKLNASLTFSEALAVNTRSRLWPKDAHALSKHLTRIKSNLLEVGITFEKYTSNGARIRITYNGHIDASVPSDASEDLDFLS